MIKFVKLDGRRASASTVYQQAKHLLLAVHAFGRGVQHVHHMLRSLHRLCGGGLHHTYRPLSTVPMLYFANVKFAKFARFEKCGRLVISEISDPRDPRDSRYETFAIFAESRGDRTIFRYTLQNGFILQVVSVTMLVERLR